MRKTGAGSVASGEGAAAIHNRGEADGTWLLWRRTERKSRACGRGGGGGSSSHALKNTADPVHDHAECGGTSCSVEFAGAEAWGFTEGGGGHLLGSTRGEERGNPATPASHASRLKCAPTCRIDWTCLFLFSVALLSAGVDGVHECAWQYNDLKWDLSSLVHHR